MHRHPLASRPAAAAGVVLALALGGPAAASADRSSAGGPVAPPRVDVLVVGDSLAVGMRPFLVDHLADREIRWDVRSGRTTPQGMARLRRQLRTATPEVVVVSLGTNDGSDPRRFADRIRRTLRDIPRETCVVWADIIRPSRKGAYRELNRVLRDKASRTRRLKVVSWRKAVKRGDVRLPDGLHPDRDGYRHRSRLFARTVDRRC